MTDSGLPRLPDAEFLRSIAEEWMANADVESSLLSDANQMIAIADHMDALESFADALHVALCRAYEGRPIGQDAIDAAQEFVKWKRSRKAGEK